MAATPSPNYNDQQLLAGDATFQSRVRQSMINACVGFANAQSGTYWRERQTYAVGVMGAPDSYKVIFSQMVAANSAVIGDATVGGTVPLTSGNVATQAALVTDGHIDATITSNFNSFFRTPGF
jgi:hypothetical protein